MKMFNSIVVLSLLMSFAVNAQECNMNSYSLDGLTSKIRLGESIDSALELGEGKSKARLGETVVLSGPYVDESTESSVCYDRTSFDTNAIILDKFDKLQEKKIIDERGCVAEGTFGNEETNDLFDIMMAVIQSKKMKIVQLQNKQSNISEVVLTNSDDNDFARKNAFTTRDKLEIAGITILSSVIGRIIEKREFAGQKDKMMHNNAGIIINIAGNLTSYAIIEGAGLGNKLKLTKKQKKVAILLTGSILGFAAAWGKERFYDYYHKDIHTYDPKMNGDTGATWLGGGLLTPLILRIAY